MSAAQQAGFRQPGEWAAHRACWLAFPSDNELWPTLGAVQTAFASMCHGIATPPRDRAHPVGPESLEILVRDEAAEALARTLLAGLPARFHQVTFGDIWMRDIAPVFLTNEDGALGSVRFRFNGWGGKYLYPGDDRVAERVQALVPCEHYASSLVLEGGGVESDGTGVCLTTRDVALNPNRNPGRSEREIETALKKALGADRVIFLDRGLRNDHTDGHIDNVARFIAPGKVVCMRAADRRDPNADILVEIERGLKDAGLEVATIPSPGLVRGRDRRALPASYLNFYIANHAVVVPVFGAENDERALSDLGALFPDRHVHPVQAKVLVEEGGTVHCITQQEPLGGKP